MFDFLIVAAFGVLGLLGHVARKKKWLEWLLRLIIFGFFSAESFTYSNRGPDLIFNQWASNILLGMAVATLLLLFIPIRRIFSVFFTGLDCVFSGQVFRQIIKKTNSWPEFFQSQKIFVPSSIPHMIGLFVYVSTFFYLASSTDPNTFDLPALPIPIPLPLAQLFSYNGLGLILLSFCGVGIFVTRHPKESCARLGWVKPTKAQIGVGIGLILFSFLYDYCWSIFTHHLGGQDLASKLSSYNAGTFSVVGGFAPSVVLALATALCAGIGEETLIRGALQPVFGIFPAALLHGMLHGQFAHAPVFIVQVTIWSTCMGIVRRYTNTTTTIIGHSGFNFLTTFLFAFNP